MLRWRFSFAFSKYFCLSENVMVPMSLEVNCLGYFRFNSLFSNIVVVAIKVSGLVLLRR